MVEKQEVTVVAVSLCNIIRRYIEDLENSGRQRKGRSEFFLFGKIIIIIIIIIILIVFKNFPLLNIILILNKKKHKRNLRIIIGKKKKDTNHKNKKIK
jgi:uncharacterized membrane protein YdbT with pleckstrin-like domain